MGVLFFSNLSFASFPVAQEQTQQTIIIEKFSEKDQSFWTKMTTKPLKIDFVGLAAGFLFGLIGIGAIYLLSKDENKRRSSIYGFGAFLLFFLGNE